MLKNDDPMTGEFVSVVLPCLDEASGVGQSVDDAYRGLRLAGVPGEVIVVDNGSVDASPRIAEAAGARVVHEPRLGTGAATLAGIRAARGQVTVTCDADGSYNLWQLGTLLKELGDGADLVIGSRLLGEIEAGAMPRLHRHLGTPFFNTLLRLMSGARLRDCQSGYRAFRRDKALDLGLERPGFESVTELIIRATRAGWVLHEVPVGYRKRIGHSKLRTWQDGWRHLRLVFGTTRKTGVSACRAMLTRPE